MYPRLWRVAAVKAELVGQRFSGEVTERSIPTEKAYAVAAHLIFEFLNDDALKRRGRDQTSLVANGFAAQIHRHEQLTGSIQVAKVERPWYHLASGQLDALGECAIVPDGGSAGKGYIHSRLRVDPSDWYFPCHFHQDPVMPGSLGVEAIFQAMRLFALHQELGKAFNNPQITHRQQHTVLWKYRGQIVPQDDQVELEIHISTVEIHKDRITVTGDASLWKQGLRIYEVTQVAIDIREECVLQSV